MKGVAVGGAPPDVACACSRQAPAGACRGVAVGASGLSVCADEAAFEREAEGAGGFNSPRHYRCCKPFSSGSGDGGGTVRPATAQTKALPPSIPPTRTVRSASTDATVT